MPTKLEISLHGILSHSTFQLWLCTHEWLSLQIDLHVYFILLAWYYLNESHSHIPFLWRWHWTLTAVISSSINSVVDSNGVDLDTRIIINNQPSWFETVLHVSIISVRGPLPLLLKKPRLRNYIVLLNRIWAQGRLQKLRETNA